MQIHGRDCLRKLGEEMRFVQAVEIINMLNNSETLEDWYGHPIARSLEKKGSFLMCWL
jgi:hypothetical protein